MGIGFTLVKFVGIPAVIIVALGAALNFFRPQIFGAASSVGEVFTGIFTQPIRGAIDQINQSIGDLPDINIDIPGINITGGGINITNPFEGFEFPDLFGGGNGDTAPPTPYPTTNTTTRNRSWTTIYNT